MRGNKGNNVAHEISIRYQYGNGRSYRPLRAVATSEVEIRLVSEDFSIIFTRLSTAWSYLHSKNQALLLTSKRLRFCARTMERVQNVHFMHWKRKTHVNWCFRYRITSNLKILSMNSAGVF
jgi:hypothetical protein